MSSANSPAEIANAEVSPPTKVGLRNSAKSNIGARWSSSTATKAASSTADAASEPTTVVEPQP